MSDYDDSYDMHAGQQGANLKFNYSEQSKGFTALVCILAAASVLATGIAFHSLGRAEQAIEESRRIRTEARLMEADTQYIRAYLSARGIHVPANHEEAEQ